MATVTGYRDLLVWQKAVDLGVECYQATAEFPKFERYALSSQLQRAAVSVPANIAEGQGRDGTREFLHFLSISHGSLMALETRVEIACRLGYVDPVRGKQLLACAAEVGRMLNGLIRSLRERLRTTEHPPPAG